MINALEKNKAGKEKRDCVGTEGDNFALREASVRASDRGNDGVGRIWEKSSRQQEQHVQRSWGRACLLCFRDIGASWRAVKMREW